MENAGLCQEVIVDVLRDWLTDGGELALLDVREHGEYGQAHLFFAIPAPYSLLEWRIARLVPRLGTRIVVYDADGGSVALKAIGRLRALGYGAVHGLAGGLAAWKRAGFSVFSGVNVPSKAFGERVEHHFRTPRISAGELAALQATGADVMVLDGRPLHEYRKMSIPGAVCCPNGELPLRAVEIVASPQTMIVVNCAGRTRSIVGAQTLIDMGLPNEIRALENGTQGWHLQDLALEHNADRYYPAQVSALDMPRKQQAAARFARENNVRFASFAQIEEWRLQPDRTTFLCDIRTPEEVARGALPGAIAAPGGQLIQTTDHFLGTRNARVVVYDTECVRAIYIAVWMKRMGWDVHVLGDAAANLTAPPAAESSAFVVGSVGTAKATEAAGAATAATEGRRAVEPMPWAEGLAELTADDLQRHIGDRHLLLDLRPGMQYRKSHVKGAVWSIRPKLAELGLAPGTVVVLIVENPVIAALAALDLGELGVVVAGYFMWGRNRPGLSGLELEQSPQDPPDAQCIDYLFFVHDRHDGNKEAARQYLSWELGLLDQMDSMEMESISRNL